MGERQPVAGPRDDPQLGAGQGSDQVARRLKWQQGIGIAVQYDHRYVYLPQQLPDVESHQRLPI